MKTRSVFEAQGKAFRTKNISSRVQKISISPIKEMSILADEFAQKIQERIISFGQGIPYYDTPAHIKKALREALGQKDTARYTLEPGIPELRELVAKTIQKEKGVSAVSINEVMITTGCQEAIACALISLIDEGDEVLLPGATYASHIEQVIQFGGKPLFIPLDEASGWKLDLEAAEKLISEKTKVILLSNPSNPTGALLDKKDIERLTAFIKKHDLILITDETYDFITYKGKACISPASIKAIRDRVVVCGSFSKKYALTGYRVGFAFGPEGILDHMLKVHDALTICAPAISQKAAIAALSGPQVIVDEFIKKLTYNRDLICKELDNLKNIFSYQEPMGAYYILAKYTLPYSSFELALKLLYEAYVIVIPGDAFGPQGKNHIRFSFAGDPRDIKEGFRRIAHWLSANS